MSARRLGSGLLLLLTAALYLAMVVVALGMAS